MKPRLKRMASTALYATVCLHLAITLSTECAEGCGRCDRISDRFAFSHSRSLDIALATKSALEKGHISRSPVLRGELVSYRPKPFKQVPAPMLAEAWLQRQVFRDYTEPLVIEVLCIDTHEAYAAEVRRGLLLPQQEWKRKADLTLVTTKTLLAALLDGEIELADAEGLGLATVEGNNSSLLPLLVTKSTTAGLEK